MKRIACERPLDLGVPIARWSLPDLRREVLARGLVATIGGLPTQPRILLELIMRRYERASTLLTSNPSMISSGTVASSRLCARA